jgi:CRP-like cAMP-binding protein
MDDSLSFSGKLSFISLADLFQILGGNSSTGILKITSQYVPNPGQIYFVNGNPINAACDNLKGIDALYQLFGWLDAKFEFYEKDVQIKKVINQGRMEIVLDALRMLDDGDIKKLGPPADLLSDESIKKDSLPIIRGPITDYSYISGEEEFDDGQSIVKEGKYGKWIWLVLEGTADVVRETENGPMTISRLGEGSFIGTFTALLFGKYARKSTVVARSKVILGVLDTERLSREFNDLSPEFRAVLLSLDNRLVKITDRAVTLYEKKQNVALPKGVKAVIKKDSSKQEAFSITEGVAYVIDQTEKGDFPIITLEKEDIFGNIPFQDMIHEPRSASVLASNDLKTRDLDVESLQKEYENLSNMFRSFIYNICTCISLTTRVAHNLYTGKGKTKA